MTNQQIKARLNSIIDRIEENRFLSSNFDERGHVSATLAVALEDHFIGEPDVDGPAIVYNGWHDDLLGLIIEIGK